MILDIAALVMLGLIALPFITFCMLVLVLSILRVTSALTKKKTK